MNDIIKLLEKIKKSDKGCILVFKNKKFKKIMFLNTWLEQCDYQNNNQNEIESYCSLFEFKKKNKPAELRHLSDRVVNFIVDKLLYKIEKGDEI